MSNIIKLEGETKMTTKKRKHGNDFVTTAALRKYRDRNCFSLKELSDNIGEPQTCVANWISRNRVPKAVLKRIKARIPRDEKPKTVAQKNGDLYVIYVEAQYKEALASFCGALGINLQKVL